MLLMRATMQHFKYKATVGILLTCFAIVFAIPSLHADSENTFEAVAPVLIRHCLQCHQGSEPGGGLNLTTAEHFVAGGDSGKPTNNGTLKNSLLWDRVSNGEMPPESTLSEAELESIRAWIHAGAPWQDRKLHLFDMTTEQRAGTDWWSLQPLKQSTIPADFRNEPNPIDAFVKARLHSCELELSPEADSATLFRRLSLHLHGMNPSQKAYIDLTDFDHHYNERVEIFLNSPRYGERWARHWLDLARFGESNGFERDKARPDAWRYRDWVIEAFNNNMPYDEFCRMQIAGDCLPKAGTDGTIATGFLVAGAYDDVGQSQQSAAMRAVVRQDELEDYVGTVSQAFLGLTTNCARCHDHKFDPILQSEYYSLCAALDGVKPGRRNVTPAAVLAETEKEISNLKRQIDETVTRLKELESSIRQEVNKKLFKNRKHQTVVLQPIAHWDFDRGFNDTLGTLHGKAEGGAFSKDGKLILDGKKAHVLTEALEQPLLEKTLVATVYLQNLEQGGGAAISLLSDAPKRFDAIVFGERQTGKWIAGSENFVRTTDLSAPAESRGSESRQPIHMAISYAADGTISVYRNGDAYGASYKRANPVYYPEKTRVGFGIRLLPVGGNRMLTGQIEDASLYDRVLTAEEIRSLAMGQKFIRNEELSAMIPKEQNALRGRLRDERNRLLKKNIQVRKQYAYAVQPRQPRPTHRLIRGNTNEPAELVMPAGLASIQGVNPSFELPANATDQERRKKLAEWITNEKNPLFSRVIANRIWQHHFGTGIVRTPSDFGFTGGKPSHPELLDFLANHLIESGWNLKELHRLIVTSKTWKQAVTENTLGNQIDVGNRLLWRGNRSRLDAESIRDSILQMAGQLNESGGGPSYQDFRTFNFNSQFYEVLDREGPQYNRRTIYRMIIRSGRHRLLDVFDCPDPSATAPKRSRTTTPLQSLSLLNHPFTIRMSGHFAHRVRNEMGQDLTDQVTRAVQLAWFRLPTLEERETFTTFVKEHDLEALCRALINSNEFLYVD
jgi:mono/diheme cytochrome c family protein